jgi:hypothetical protein
MAAENAKITKRITIFVTFVFFRGYSSIIVQLALASGVAKALTGRRFLGFGFKCSSSIEDLHFFIALVTRGTNQRRTRPLRLIPADSSR